VPAAKSEGAAGFAALFVSAVFKGEFTTVSFGDLAAKNQTNTGAALLGREEGNEQVRRIGKSRALVDNPDVELCALPDQLT